LESTVKYLGVEIEDSLEISEQAEVLGNRRAWRFAQSAMPGENL
jgi:hypothetical protein